MNTPTLLPCPFCGNDEPEFERLGTPRQSCIVICGNCGARHECSDEGVHSGSQWNTRHADPATQDKLDAERWRFSMRYQKRYEENPQLRCEAMDEMWRKVYQERRRAPTRDEYEAATDAAIAECAAREDTTATKDPITAYYEDRNNGAHAAKAP